MYSSGAVSCSDVGAMMIWRKCSPGDVLVRRCRGRLSTFAGPVQHAAGENAFPKPQWWNRCGQSSAALNASTPVVSVMTARHRASTRRSLVRGEAERPAEPAKPGRLALTMALRMGLSSGCGASVHGVHLEPDSFRGSPRSFPVLSG